MDANQHRVKSIVALVSIMIYPCVLQKFGRSLNDHAFGDAVVLNIKETIQSAYLRSFLSE